MNKFFAFIAIAMLSVTPTMAAPQAIFCENPDNAGMVALQWSTERSLGMDTETTIPGCRVINGEVKVFPKQLFLADFVGPAIEESAIATMYEVAVYATINGYIVVPFPPKQVPAE